jgi:hypothetical protein
MTKSHQAAAGRGVMKKSLSREELLALPPVTNLLTLAQTFGISEPTAREWRRRGEFEAMGITILRLGVQYRVVTSSLLRVLDIDPSVTAAGPALPGPAATTDDLPTAKERSHAKRTPAA